ncbi:MAG: hypothetical protein AAGE61_06865 [Pseudomonadota bacterium]
MFAHALLVSCLAHTPCVDQPRQDSKIVNAFIGVTEEVVSGWRKHDRYDTGPLNKRADDEPAKKKKKKKD